MQETRADEAEDGEVERDGTNDGTLQIDNAVEDHVAEVPRQERQVQPASEAGGLAIQTALTKIAVMHELKEIASFIIALENSYRMCPSLTTKHVRSRIGKEAFFNLEVKSRWHLQDLESSALEDFIDFLKEIKVQVSNKNESRV